MQAAAPIPFKNLYQRRRAATDRPCWVCGKPTQEVLTHSDIDFFFTCANHCQDPGFCTLSTASGTASSPFPPNTGAATTTGRAPAGTTSAPAAAAGQKSDESAATKPTATLPIPASYVLHSRIFSMRAAEYREKQRVKAKQSQLGALPSVPKQPLPPERT
ncbi:hypothetical protein AMAG_01125 [Allomyces macrogynus ATCC 38327]|uniref:DUF1742-domain-containing protein n=1 Tax=Allomyces macrogynus (strain ATCC 38327) TaxID=578462 RepID=A0A0L0RYS1_ALLM3|nr:hypothetical protein AMAG_01125 [Allomyces macrogynus ATCC 38327]|eukprot:KNE55211.1 hypothetical protein AMAG_01125 [Allomyces macrogynus ATCC 38327]